MAKKPTYEELEQRVKELENESVGRSSLEHALRESQQRLELAVDGANLAMWDWNVDTGNVKYSQRWAEILGYLPEEIKPHVSAWKELVHPEDMPQVMQKLNPNLEGLTSFYECEHRLKTKSGDWKWVLARGKVVERDNDGKPLRHTGTQFDINDRVIAQEALKEARNVLEHKVAERTVELVNTNELLKQEIKERKQAEEALRKSEKRYKLLADNVTDVIWTRDMDLNFTYISPSVFEQQGFTVEEAMARPPEEAWTPDSFKRNVEILKEELEIEKRKQKDMARSRTIEVEVRCKDGSTIWTEAKMSFLRNPNGEPTGIIGVTRDTTKRRQMEEALQQGEERYRSLVENTIYGFFIHEIPSGRFLFLNPRACELFRYTMQEGLELTVWDALSSEDHERIKKRVQARIEGNKLGSDIQTYTAVRKDGSTFRLEVSSSSIIFQGKPATQGIFRDITEQERLEQQLMQAQKTQAIGTLAGGIAHDFNNILSPIILYTEMVLEDISEKGPLRFSLEEILKASMRAKDLVKQILTFSRQSEQERIPLIIYPVIKEALRLLRSTLPSTIEIRQNIEAEDSVVLADPTQIHQILMNLGTNAANAMRERGGILKVSLVYVDLHSDDTDHIADLEPGQYIKLTVSDTGHGIEPAIMDKIFDPYFTAEEKGKGTGLGLSVVQGIVNSHGGHISAYSEQNKGARFDVYLPLFDLADIKAETVSPEKLTIGNEHILLVDDEKPIVDVVQQMLERLGYQVTVRTSSIEALEVFRVLMNKFDLVITDLTMPNMTGDKLAGELMNIRPDIPIILCTGFSEKMSKERAEALGINGFLMKPIVKNDIAKTVREVLDKS